MKIVHASPYASEYGGNFIASLSRLREACSRQGWELAAVFPEAARGREWCAKLAADGCRLHFIPMAAPAPQVAWQLYRVVRAEQARLLHTHFSDLDAAASLAGGMAGVPVVWHLRSDFRQEEDLARKLKDRLKFGVLGGHAHVFVTSEHLKEKPVRSGLDPRRVHVIPNGIELARLGAADKLRDPSAVLMFGWHPWIKGVDVALEAFELAVRARPDLTLLLVGAEGARAEVRRRFPGGEPAWLRLLPHSEDIAGYFGRAGIFLSASRGEGFSNAAHEALASGCMLVSSDIPALRWMKGRLRCWWFDSEDAAGLAARLLECASVEPGEREKISRANAEHVRLEFAMEKWAAKVAGAYGKILGAGPGATERRSFDEVLEANLPAMRRWAKLLFARLKVGPGARVLDVGAASGAFVAACLELGYHCDGAEPWGQARENAARLGRRLGLELAVADGRAEALPFPDRTFDVVHARSVIEHVEDAEKAFAEAWRVLKPGGVFWFSTASSMCPVQKEIRGFPLFGWYPDALKRRIMLWARDNKPGLIGHTSAPALHWFTPWKARRMLRAAGFGRVLDRWDLRCEEEGHALLLRIIRSCGPLKLAADVVVPDCSYAAIKDR